MGKGEIARKEQFLLFPQCFQKTCAADAYEQGLVWERVKVVYTSRSAFTEYFKEQSLTHSPRFYKSESITLSDWLNHLILQIRSCITFKFRKFWRKRPRIFLRIVCAYGLLYHQTLKIWTFMSDITCVTN